MRLLHVSRAHAVRALLVCSCAAAGAALASCHSDSTGPNTPSAIVFEGSTTPTGTVGQSVTPAPTIQIHDASGHPISVPFTVTITGGGTLTALPASTAAGTTSLGTWTLGTVAGTQTLVVHSTGYPDLTISAIAKAGPPSVAVPAGPVLAAVSTGTVASGVVPAIKVTDQFGNAVSGVSVTTQLTGGGSVQTSNPVTNSLGVASAGAWTVGSVLTPQTLAMTAGALSPVTFQFMSTGTFASTAYTVDVRFVGGAPTPVVEAAFATAAARVEKVVTSSLTAINATNIDLSSNTAGCGVSQLPVLNETIQNLVIYAVVVPIDGVGGILASSGPCGMRSTNNLPFVGVMEFDSADLAALATAGTINSVVLHEMQHVLGFGTLWCTASEAASNSVCAPAGTAVLQATATNNPIFTGANARTEYVAAGGITSAGVPVEAGGGQGTALSHWRQSTFVTELMTGFLTGQRQYSRITMASLADLGYPVSFVSADPYTVVAPSSIQSLEPAAPAAFGERLIRPSFTIDETSGRMRRVSVDSTRDGTVSPQGLRKQ